MAIPPLTPMATLRWAVLRPLLSELAPKRVLEIGCGQGSVGARLAERAQYVGVEPDERSWSVARERIEPLGGRVLNGSSKLVSAEERFDAVCAFEVLEHMEHDVDAMREWLRFLAPGGAVLVSVPAWPRRFGTMDRLVGHYRRYTPEALDGLLAEAGCVHVRHVLYGWPLGYALEYARNRIADGRGGAHEESMAARSAASGRLFQPHRVAGVAVRGAVLPFAAVQRLRPGTGTGLIGVGRLPG